MSFALKDAANWIKSDVCVKITVFTGFNLISLVFFARFVHQSIFSQSSHVGWEILSKTNNCVSMKRQNSKSKQCFSVICTVFSRTAHTFCRYYFIKISDIVKWCAWNNNNVNKNSESFSLHWKFIFVLFFWRCTPRQRRYGFNAMEKSSKQLGISEQGSCEQKIRSTGEMLYGKIRNIIVCTLFSLES